MIPAVHSIPYALRHGQRVRFGRRPPRWGVPRFRCSYLGCGVVRYRSAPGHSRDYLAEARSARLLVACGRRAPLPPMFPATVPGPGLRRWRAYL